MNFVLCACKQDQKHKNKNIKCLTNFFCKDFHNQIEILGPFLMPCLYVSHIAYTHTHKLTHRNKHAYTYTHTRTLS